MGRPVERIDPILKLIDELWRKYPDLRLMQLLLNALPHKEDQFYTEDTELQKCLEKLKEEWSKD